MLKSFSYVFDKENENRDSIDYRTSYHEVNIWKCKYVPEYVLRAKRDIVKEIYGEYQEYEIVFDRKYIFFMPNKQSKFWMMCERKTWDLFISY